MSTIGELSVNINANTSSFQKGLKSAAGNTEQLRKSFNVGVRAAAKYTAALGATGAAITAALVRSGLQAVDEQAKLARSLGASTAAVQGLTRAADRAGVSKGALTSSLAAMNRRLGEAEQGTGGAARALQRLNLDARNLSSMDIDERMATLSDAMRQAGMSSQEMAYNLRELGIRNQEMVNLMQEGGESIRDSRRAVEGFGVAVSDVDAAKIEAANDAMGEIRNVIQGVSNQMAIQFAPILEAISQKMTDLAADSGGFANQISKGMSHAITATAFFADAIEGVRRTFEIVGKAIAGMVHGTIGLLFDMAHSVIAGPIEAMNLLIRTINRIPGVNIPEGEIPEFAQDFKRQADESYRAVSIAADDISETLQRKMPGTFIRQFAEDAAQASQDAADATVSARQNENEAHKQLDDEMSEHRLESIREALEKETELREKNLEAIREYLLDEAEAQEEGHEKKLEQLREAKESELLTEQEFNEMKEKLEQDHQNKMTEIEKRGLTDREKFERMSMKRRVSTVARELESMTAGVSGSNKKMFKLNQKAGIANATISAWEGFNKSLSAYPQPLASAMAAGHLASGMAAVRQIKSQSFGGGGSGGGGSARAPARSTSMPTTTQGPGQQQSQTITRNINLSGEGLTQQFIRQLVPELNEAAGDGMRFNAR